MSDVLLDSDIEDPYERLIEECPHRFYFYDLGICYLMHEPCQKTIYDGHCKVLRKYFREKERKQNENY